LFHVELPAGSGPDQALGGPFHRRDEQLAFQPPQEIEHSRPADPVQFRHDVIQEQNRRLTQMLPQPYCLGQQQGQGEGLLLAPGQAPGSRHVVDTQPEIGPVGPRHGKTPGPVPGPALPEGRFQVRFPGQPGSSTMDTAPLSQASAPSNVATAPSSPRTYRWRASVTARAWTSNSGSQASAADRLVGSPRRAALRCRKAP
jgi:hypothetical protein